jgi:hypothetical protein
MLQHFIVVIFFACTVTFAPGSDAATTERACAKCSGELCQPSPDHNNPFIRTPLQRVRAVSLVRGAMGLNRVRLPVQRASMRGWCVQT